jgi:hypothetical protein
MRIFNPRGWVSAVAAVFLVAFMTALNGAAAVLIHKTFNDLVGEADAVLAGTVTDKQSVWADDKSTIYTFVTLSGLEVLDGEWAQTEFTLRLEGGEVEDAGEKKGLKIPGIPEFTIDERVIVFIKDNTQEVCPLVGWHQGILRLKRDAITNETRLYTLDDNEIEGIDEAGDFLVKEKTVAVASQPGAGVQEDDPEAKKLRLQHESQLKQKKADTLSKSFTFQGLKDSINKKSFESSGDGKKVIKQAQSADIKVHRAGRLKGHPVMPKQNN